MKLYFLSSTPCILRVGGAYFGQVGDFEKFAEITLKDNLFAEFIPQNALPVCFFLNEDLLFSPPKGVELYLTEHGAAIFVREFPPNDFSLKLIAQNRFENTLVTVFSQGETQVAIEDGKELFLCRLAPFPACEILQTGGVFLLKSADLLYALNGRGEILLRKNYLAYTATDDGFSIVCPLGDSLGRRSKESYTAKNGTLSRTEYSLLSPQSEEHAPIAYAFFESVLIGGDFQAFLSDELTEKADGLKEFLGDFLSVVVTDDPFKAGVVKRRRERVFDVVYYQVETENGKITDIHN